MWYITYKTKLVANKAAYKLGIISAPEYHENQLEIRSDYLSDRAEYLANHVPDDPIEIVENMLHNAMDHGMEVVGNTVDKVLDNIQDFTN
jgi:hypothetical protein